MESTTAASSLGKCTGSCISKERLAFLKELIFTILNGVSFAVIVALIPSALTSQILAHLPHTPLLDSISFMTNLAQCALPLLAACATGFMLKLSMMQTGCIALATMVSAGNITAAEKGFAINGTGVILNILLVIFISIFLVKLSDKLLGQFKAIFSSTLVLLIGGGIGLITLPYMKAVQDLIGVATAQATTFTPLVMGLVLGMIFAFLVLMPLSSVVVALAITLAGVGSGAANAGIAAAAFTLALMGSSANTLGGTLTHLIGSPKVQMANLLAHPQLFIPVFIASGAAGFCASVLGVCGTPFSAGFGFSGLIGPLTALNTTPGDMVVLRSLLGTIGVPAIMACAMNFVFIKRKFSFKGKDGAPLIIPEYLKLPDM